jgi:hypothetical protein
MAYPNYTRNCFITSDTDRLTNHFPITPEVLMAWYADIRAGNGEIERPSVATLFRMRTNRGLKEARRKREGRRPGAREVSNPAFQWPPLPLGGQQGLVITVTPQIFLGNDLLGIQQGLQSQQGLQGRQSPSLLLSLLSLFKSIQSFLLLSFYNSPFY